MSRMNESINQSMEETQKEINNIAHFLRMVVNKNYMASSNRRLLNKKHSRKIKSTSCVYIQKGRDTIRDITERMTLG